MSRVKNFARGVFSGYVQTAANIVATLASVPLALHYLSKEQFALWALVAQIAGYFSLIDLGMTSAVGRFLADHKDERDGGHYGAVLKAGALVFSLQGVVIALAALLLAQPLAGAFEIDAAQRSDFIFLLRGHGLILAFTFATKIFGSPFWAFQRYDLMNYCNTVGFGLQLTVLWLGFSAGYGVRSMLLAYVATSLLPAVWMLVAGLRLGFFPRRTGWGRMEPEMLRGLFAFGRDLFLMTLGNQLVSASQLIVITRVLGLEAAAVWSVATKIFALAQQVVHRILDSSAAAFAEMMARSERARLQLRFADLMTLTASLSAWIALSVALCNSSFLQVWTKGKISWQDSSNWLMALYVIIYATTRCMTGFTGITKQIRAMKYVNFVEGIAFVSLSALIVPQVGLNGVIISGIVTNLLCSGAYGLYRTRDYFGLRLAPILGWLKEPLVLLLVFGVAGFALTRLMTDWPDIRRLGVEALLAASLGGIGWWSLGLSPRLRQEIKGRMLTRRRPIAHVA